MLQNNLTSRSGLIFSSVEDGVRDPAFGGHSTFPSKPGFSHLILYKHNLIPIQTTLPGHKKLIFA